MQSHWSEPESKNDLGMRVHSSRLLGSESELVLHGGGNTSVKTEEYDHTGRKVEVLRVKGSGSDLSTITKEGFTGLRMNDLLAAKNVKAMDDFQMIDYFRKSMLEPGQPAPSVEAFLHAFLPFKFVDHTHADSIVALTNTDLTDEDIRSIFGNVVVVPYVPPGFKLARALLDRVEEIRKADAVVLRKHGLFTYSDSAKESYRTHIEMVTKAEKAIDVRVKGAIYTHMYDKKNLDLIEFLPKLRGKVSSFAKKVLQVNTDADALEISCSAEAEELCSYGPATPDMLIRTKHDFLYVSEPDSLSRNLDIFVEKYKEEYSEFASKYPVHDPYPSVIVVRGVGIITQATSKREARIIMDDALHSFKVNAKSRKLGKHEFISMEESYDMEYWPLQEAKLKKFTPEKMRGMISVVTGAAAGIGLEAFKTLALNGSYVIALDVDPTVTKAGESISKETGMENVSLQTDLGDEEQIKQALKHAILEFGGVDVVFNNAGILRTAPLDKISTSEMDAMYRVNSRGTFIITRETFRIMKEQGIGGNFVFNITKNLTNPGAEMAMYGSTKAFAAQLSHYVAKEGGRYRIRSNIINPDKVFRGSKIWGGGVLESRAKAKGQTVEEYKTQNLLGVEVLPEHVVGVLMALIDDSTFGATTDAMIPVDGGIK